MQGTLVNKQYLAQKHVIFLHQSNIHSIVEEADKNQMSYKHTDTFFCGRVRLKILG